MKLARFLLPFLFVRNWHDGSWELSRARVTIFCAVCVLVTLSLIIAYILQAPVVYTKSV
jgi:heme/copper-type cytochrome/quinol oxidase subunit 4